MLPEGDISPEDLLKLLTVKEAKSVRDDLPDFQDLVPTGPGYEDRRPIAWRTLMPSTRWSIANGGLLLGAYIPQNQLPGWTQKTTKLKVFEWHWMIGPTTMIRVRLPERVRVLPVSPKAQNFAFSPTGRNFWISDKNRSSNADPVRYAVEDLSPGATKDWRKVQIEERSHSAEQNHRRKLKKGTDYTRGEYSSRALMQILGSMGLLDQRFNQWTSWPRRADEIFSLYALQFDTSTEICQVELIHLPDVDPHRGGYVCQEESVLYGQPFPTDGLAVKWFTGQDMPNLEEEE